MRCRHPDTYRPRRRRPVGLARRVAVTAVALMLVVAADVAAALGPRPGGPKPHRAAATTSRASPPRYGGEPLIPAGATVPAAARAVAVSFIRDYAHWNNGRRSTIPPKDATVRVIELIEHQPRGTPVSVAAVVHSVRIGTAGPDRYVVTSAMGNFLIGSAGDRWLVVSLPGD